MAYTTIDDPEAYFQTVIYTGNGSADNAITLPGDTNMQPDLVWIKNRSEDDGHCLFDAVRGATIFLDTAEVNIEATDADTLDSFTSDGFQVDADVKVNTNAENYVAWCWKESATSGFDIVNHSGTGSNTTVSHALSAVPHFIVPHNRELSEDWFCYHQGMTTTLSSGQVVKGDPEDYYININTTGAPADGGPQMWQDTAPTSSVISVGTANGLNKSGDDIIYYIWAPVQGFSKFGIYTGNGDADGTFINTGFRPAMVIIKRTDSTTGADWIIMDNKRNTYNPVKARLRANLASDEDSPVDFCDFLSNGLKMRDTSTTTNADGGRYIYAAFAEAPFVNSNGVPCNAR